MTETVGRTVTIRPATIFDADQISALIHEIVPTLGYGTEVAVARFLFDQYRPDIVRNGIEDGSHRWLLAVESATICGAVYLDMGASYFGGLHVRKRRQGTGKALMRAVVDLADQVGVDVLTGSTLATNDAVLALTNQFGFCVSGPDPDKVHFSNAPFMLITRDTR